MTKKTRKTAEPKVTLKQLKIKIDSLEQIVHAAHRLSCAADSRSAGFSGRIHLMDDAIRAAESAQVDFPAARLQAYEDFPTARLQAYEEFANSIGLNEGYGRSSVDDIVYGANLNRKERICVLITQVKKFHGQSISKNASQKATSDKYTRLRSKLAQLDAMDPSKKKY